MLKEILCRIALAVIIFAAGLATRGAIDLPHNPQAVTGLVVAFVFAVLGVVVWAWSRSMNPRKDPLKQASDQPTKAQEEGLGEIT